MKRFFILDTLLLFLLLAACGAPPTKVPPSPMVQNTISPTRTQHPTPTTTITMTHARLPTATLDPKKVDPGLVYGEPCKAPCWFNMIPGKTTVMEILDLMPSLRAMESPYDITQGDGIIPYIFQTRPDIDGSMSVALVMGRDKKVLEAIDSSALNFAYSLGQLIVQFGEPEAIVDTDPGAKVAEPCKDWTALDEATPAGSIVRILYPQQGLLFKIQVPTTMNVRSGDQMLCPEMRVNSFCYYSPMTLHEAMTNNRLADLCGDTLLERISEENLVEWHGFGSGY